MKNTRINLTNTPIANIAQIVYNLNMSVRQIKKSYISCTGYLASYKNKSQIAFESVLERDFYMILEFDDNVIKYEEQPMTIQYKYIDGKKRRYTPDTLVTYKDKSQRLFEVKYASEIENNTELQTKISLLRKHINDEYKIEFEVFTDKEINKTYLENLKFLYKFAFIDTGNTKLTNINNILNNVDSIIVKDLLRELESSPQKQLTLIPYIWTYVFHNIGVVNIYKKLTMSTVIKKGFTRWVQ